jgi:hypothetical protein
MGTPVTLIVPKVSYETWDVLAVPGSYKTSPVTPQKVCFPFSNHDQSPQLVTLALPTWPTTISDMTHQATLLVNPATCHTSHT